MAYSAPAVANRFITAALSNPGFSLTPMKLQRLLYLAQLWHAHFYSTELILDHFQKWETGPVLPSLHHSLKSAGSGPILHECMRSLPDGQIAKPQTDPDDRAAEPLILRVIEAYGHLSGPELSALVLRDFFPNFAAKAIGEAISLRELQTAALFHLAKQEAAAIGDAAGPACAAMPKSSI